MSADSSKNFSVARGEGCGGVGTTTWLSSLEPILMLIPDSDRPNSATGATVEQIVTMPSNGTLQHLAGGDQAHNEVSCTEPTGMARKAIVGGGAGPSTPSPP